MGTKKPFVRPSWIPPIILMIVVLFIYTVFMFWHLVPQYQNSGLLRGSNSNSKTVAGNTPANDPHFVGAPSGGVVIVSILLHIFFLLFLASFVKVVSTHPGRPTEEDPRWERGEFSISREDDEAIERIILDSTSDLTNPETKALIRRSPLVERRPRKKEEGDQANSTPDMDGMKRKCLRCLIYKPDRCHHCKDCGCVLKMDHHCPWLANCIGFRNYKYFMLVVMYAYLTILIILCSMAERFGKVFLPIVDTGYFFKTDLPIALAYVGTILLFFVLTYFLSFHIYLSTHALTTIEHVEKKNHNDFEVKHRWKVSHIKYDKGSWLANLKEVFGPWWMAPFPVDPHPTDDGTFTVPKDDYVDDVPASKGQWSRI